MTIADRIEFLLQSIESHDRQLGDLTRQVTFTRFPIPSIVYFFHRPAGSVFVTTFPAYTYVENPVPAGKSTRVRAPTPPGAGAVQDGVYAGLGDSSARIDETPVREVQPPPARVVDSTESNQSPG